MKEFTISILAFILFNFVFRSKTIKLYCVYNYKTPVKLSELVKYCEIIIWRIRSRSYRNENLQENINESIGKYQNVTHHWLVEEQFIQKLGIEGPMEMNYTVSVVLI